MAGIFLLLGSNLGDRVLNLREARKRIEATCGPCLQASSVYRTAAWGKTDQPEFLNQALEIKTTLLPDNLLMAIQDIEKAMGRERIEKWGTRIIDIDILIYNNHVIRTRDLMLPHPQLENRRFALAPLNDIAPNLVHPLSGKKISELLDICPDQLAVEKI
jgi:2-amino-4-hydroxy-6-hydroxymethyldihydropteridine diphosphokinase